MGAPIIGQASIFQSAVWTTSPRGVRIASAVLSGMEWATAMNSTPNGPMATFSPCATIFNGIFGAPGSPSSASLGEPGGEARHIDRRAELRPKLGERADVVFVRVSDDDSNQILLRLLDKAEIRHDEIDAGQVVAGERHAKIDHQPLAGVCGPVAVKGAIHADLAQAAERGEHELALVRHLGSILRRLRSQRGLGARSGRKAEVGRLDALDPALGAHEQATARIDPLEDALAPDGAALDDDALSKTVGAIKPGGANAVECLSFAPDDKRLVEPVNEALEQLARANRPSACAGKTRGCVIDLPRRVGAIDANPNRIARAAAGEANPFNQDAGAFGAVQHQVIRPFEADFGRAGVPCRARQRHAGDEAQLRRERGGARIDQQGGGVKVALRRYPAAAAAASPGCLLASDNPHAIRLAGKRSAARLLVGRIDRAKPSDAPRRMRVVKPQGRGQKSDCAAAIAALVSGEGKNMNKRIIRAETASTMRATGDWRSNAGAGSSKYISLTILR